MYLTVGEDDNWRPYRSTCKKWSNTCVLILSVIICVTVIIFFATIALNMTQKIHVIYVEDRITFTTGEKFLSLGLDSSLIAEGLKDFNTTDPKLLKVIKALSPAYLRIGGNLADRLKFVPSMQLENDLVDDFEKCAYKEVDCNNLFPNFTMSGDQWLVLNKLAGETDLSIIFDLNVLYRFNNDSWDYRNAKKLISFSDQYNLDLHWELGNEPNAFQHEFDYEVNATQLGEDFQMLRKILNNYSRYAHSLLVGPDTTRPETDHKESELYLEEFLRKSGHVVDAITWHQYYFNGRTATLNDFISPEVFDILKWQITSVKKIARKEGLTSKPIWLGETASAYGGGAPGLSNRYVATFIWLDKLGISAKYGLGVVIRQSLFRGDYALINSDYTPAPDWWISIIYKKLVSPKVLNCYMGSSLKVRLYCHCTKPEAYFKGKPSVTVFGINISKEKVKIRIEGIVPLSNKDVWIDSYVLNTKKKLNSKNIYLNGILLALTKSNVLPSLNPKPVLAHPYVEMPPYSSVFWVIPANKTFPCY